MLTNWIKGKGKEEVSEADNDAAIKESQTRRARLLETDPELPREMGEDEKERADRDRFRQKLRDVPMSKARKMLPYDNIFRTPTALLMEGHGDFSEGMNISIRRPVHNTMVSSKWHLSSPKNSNWESSVQMNGFSELINATYSTAKRWQLMYQKTFTSGALLIAQMMAQPGMAMMGAPSSTFFGLLYYPWCPGGCTAFQYVKGQQVATSHTQQLFRGMHLGAQLTYDMTTNSTSMTYAFKAQDSRKNLEFMGEVKPDTGKWKIAVVKHDWANDMQMCTQLEYAERRSGFASLLSIGMKKALIGGGSVQAVLSGFQKVCASLELPWGGSRPGYNAVSLQYQVMYDMMTSELKHGVTLTY